MRGRNGEEGGWGGRRVRWEERSEAGHLRSGPDQVLETNSVLRSDKTF